ncbi:S53 family peptidase [Actinoallomurus rhizosphaericola]|uniref:S53 family peptidase n=1 Tax=Actinoallomurus rhizosphaericola TaxID=2952536 RepID=UPI002091B7D3|nr:S53 family peptidase [Actinoallomurus rhizosphaericola]MCO5994050.1 S53 family peptidase [Actinoallomurus rhizosphaericola]
MRRRVTGTLVGGLILALVPFLSGPASASPTAATSAAAPAASAVQHPFHHACSTPRAGRASCNALVRDDVATSEATVRAAAAAPSGLSPANLQSAYKLSTSGGSGQTVAIVDAYNAPTAEADLAVYRSQYGLPACTTANGCFKKVDQNGGTSYPKTDGGWAQEISLDLDMVSAICPNCKIVLVEASSASFANLGTAENTAARLANVISNSYGGSDASDSSYGSYYNHPGKAITVSSGDSGYGVEYPASSHYVTAVGGTSLRTASNSRGWTETAWSGAGSGCSSYNTALSGQSSFGTGCSRRAVADVSAVADPSTGVAVYDSTSYQGQSGWMVFGGTSVAAPIIAGVYGLAGNAASIDNNYPYTHSGSLFDVTSGSNGSCSTSQWCNARTGWDGPTGLGTPNGTGAF